MTEAATPVTHSFQAEVSQVLHLVIHSLYSHKDIFVRELVSNASDALDKLRFRALTEPDLYEGDTSLAIRIHADPAQQTLTIEDNGIGMTEEELVRDLGTVARSGSRAFLEQLAAQGKKDARLIGQFGVGFYSSYLVADRVEVVSRAAGAGQTAHRWISEGKDTFTVAPDPRTQRGTAIILHLRDDQKEFLENWRLRSVITRYSDYVSHPIELRTKKAKAPVDASDDASDDASTDGAGGADGTNPADGASEYETVNRASALWQRSKSEISDDQYNEFYRHLAHAGDAETALARIHFKVEGTQEFAGLLYIPREAPFDLRFGAKPRGVRLYVKRVLIMEECEELVPEWLQFVVGVIDSDDLPLNVSRELLQESSAVRTIKRQIVKQLVDTLETMAKERPEDYATFWKAFGAYVKRGVTLDYENKDKLAKLLRYESTAAEGLVSLPDYVGRMKEGQTAIYYVVGESRKGLEGAPHLEGLKKHGYEVLFMTDPVDEWTAESLAQFDGKPLISAMRADLKMENKDKAEEKKTREADAVALRALFERIRAVLGDRVSEVRSTDRLTDSPCCLVLANGKQHGYIERLLREAGRDVPKSARILEINPNHPIVKNLNLLLAQPGHGGPGDGGQGDGGPADARVSDWIELLYEQALVTEGALLDDPNGFARRITSLLATVSQASVAGSGRPGVAAG